MLGAFDRSHARCRTQRASVLVEVDTSLTHPDKDAVAKAWTAAREAHRVLLEANVPCASVAEGEATIREQGESVWRASLDARGNSGGS